MIVELPNGQEIEFPDDTSHEVMRNAIAKKFPEYTFQKASKAVQSQNSELPSWKEVFKASLKQRNPASEYASEVEKARQTPLGKALELPLYLAAPELEIPGLAKLAKFIPQIGKYLTKGIQNAIPQAGIAGGSAALSGESPLEAAGIAGGITAPFSMASQAAISSSPIARALGRGLLSAGAGGLGYGAATAMNAPLWGALSTGLASGIGVYKGLNPFKAAKKDVLKGVEGTNYEEALDAAKRLGLSYLTPAEASANPFVGATQGTIGKTSKGAEILYKKGEERLASEKKSIHNLLNTIYNPSKHTSLKESLYKSATEKKSPPDIFGLKKNEVFKSAEKRMLSESAYKEELKDIPKNSIAYLDLVKREMDDMARKAGIGTNEARLINKTKNKLVEGLDKYSPEYKEARAIAERGIVRKSLEDYFKKKEKSMTGSNFAKFISNEKNYDKLQNNLRNVPEAQTQLKDMKLIFNRLINIPTSKSAEALARTSMSKDRATSATIFRNLKEILSAGQYDKTAVELMTNPKWKEELSKLKKVSNTEKFVGDSLDLFGKAAAQKFSQE